MSEHQSGAAELGYFDQPHVSSFGKSAIPPVVGLSYESSFIPSPSHVPTVDTTGSGVSAEHPIEGPTITVLTRQRPGGVCYTFSVIANGFSATRTDTLSALLDEAGNHCRKSLVHCRDAHPDIVDFYKERIGSAAWAEKLNGPAGCTLLAASMTPDSEMNENTVLSLESQLRTGTAKGENTWVRVQNVEGKYQWKAIRIAGTA